MRLNFSFRGINVPKFKGMCVSCKHASFFKDTSRTVVCRKDVTIVKDSFPRTKRYSPHVILCRDWHSSRYIVKSKKIG